MLIPRAQRGSCSPPLLAPPPLADEGSSARYHRYVAGQFARVIGRSCDGDLMELRLTRNRWLATAVALLTAAFITTATLHIAHGHHPHVGSPSFDTQWTVIATCDYRQTPTGDVIALLQKAGIDGRLGAGSRVDPIFVPTRQASEAQQLLRGKNLPGLYFYDPLPEPRESPY